MLLGGRREAPSRGSGAGGEVETVLPGRWSLLHSAPTPNPALWDTSSPVTSQMGVGVSLPGGRVTFTATSRLVQVLGASLELHTTSLRSPGNDALGYLASC